MNNLEIYEKVRAVPDEAKKTIGGGRLKGMTDINPMWRIKKLTELFGACGIGWYVSDVTFDVRQCNDETVVNCTGLLHTKPNGEWSDPIFGIGGSKLTVKETNGFYVDDEAYKKAYTDMLSVACKALGIGADVYWSKDSTKYTSGEHILPKTPAKQNKTDFSGQYIRDLTELEKADGNRPISEKSVKMLNSMLNAKRKMNEPETMQFYREICGIYKISNFSELKQADYKSIADAIGEFKPTPC